MKIVTFGTFKGGSGKTSNAFNIAGILAETDRVLLIDMDPQSNLTSDCGVDIVDAEIPTVRMILENFEQKPIHPEAVILKSIIEELPNLDLIASTFFLFKTEDSLLITPQRESFLKNFIDDNREYLEKNYDYIIIDTNPTMSVININAFYVSDEIILSSDISTNSICGAELFCDLWESKRKALRKEDNISALIICNSDSRTKLGDSLNAYARSEVFSKDIVIDTIIPASVDIKKAEILHKPVNISFPKKKITKCYRDVVEILKEREVL